MKISTPLVAAGGLAAAAVVAVLVSPAPVSVTGPASYGNRSYFFTPQNGQPLFAKWKGNPSTNAPSAVIILDGKNYTFFYNTPHSNLAQAKYVFRVVDAGANK